MRRLVPLLALLALAACSGAKHAAPFAYDRAAPIGLRDRGVVNKNYPIRIHDVSYASPKGGRVPAYLVVPPGKGPFPAVIYMHGSGEDRFALVAPATWFAARGAVALLIDSPFARTPAPNVPTGAAGLAAIRSLYVQQVVDLRRAVDVLASLPSVDPTRIAYVGYSAGAKVGAVLAGNESRIKAYDLMSGGSAPAADFVEAAPAADKEAVRQGFANVDPLQEIRRARDALFLQDGLSDTIVPHAQLQALVDAAPKQKRVRWYRADHALNRQAIHDQLAWLAGELGLAGPVVPGAVPGP